jgi:RNA polymerase sigma factor (sigma-70 family)
MFKSEDILDLIQRDQYKSYLNLIYKMIIPVAKKVKVKYASDFLELDDIIQESVICFYRIAREGKIKNADNLKGYLYVLTKNIVLNQLRARKIVTTELNESFHELEESGSVEAEHLEKRSNMLQDALRQLSDSCKALITAYYNDNMSMKQIAVVYDYKNEDVVKTKHYKCKQKLALIINENVTFKSTLNA